MVDKRDDFDLITRYVAHHDPALREEIIVRFIPLVHFVLGRLGISQSMSADYEDAASQGLIGLIEALDRFDPKFGTQFSTYATVRIRGKILDHLRSMDWLSRGARQRIHAVQNAVTSLWGSLGRSPTDDELATHLQIDLNQLHRTMIEGSRMIVSLDMITQNNDEEESLHEVLTDHDQETPAEQYEEEELQARLVQALSTLSEREQQILSLYYYEELTFKEIGAVLEISESRVCQLHGRAIISLRANLKHSTHEASA